MKRKLAELINVIFGFRKFLLMFAVIIVAVVFRLKGLVNGAEMVDLIKNVGIAFMGANGVEHIVNAVNTHIAAKKAPGATTGPADTDESNDEETVGKEPKD